MHIIYKMDCKLDLEVILPFPRNLTFLRYTAILSKIFGFENKNFNIFEKYFSNYINEFVKHNKVNIIQTVELKKDSDETLNIRYG